MILIIIIIFLDFPSVNLANIEFLTFIDILEELYCAVELWIQTLCLYQVLRFVHQNNNSVTLKRTSTGLAVIIIVTKYKMSWQ